MIIAKPNHPDVLKQRAIQVIGKLQLGVHECLCVWFWLQGMHYALDKF